MGHVGAASHKVRQGLLTNGMDGRAWEHSKHGWPVYKNMEQQKDNRRSWKLKRKECENMSKVVSK